MWHVGLVAPRHVGSSQTRDRTRVPCIGRWILNHCATREALNHYFVFQILPLLHSFSFLRLELSQTCRVSYFILYLYLSFIFSIPKAAFLVISLELFSNKLILSSVPNLLFNSSTKLLSSTVYIFYF